jgi:tRNA dimethylallyltransferase
MPETKRAVLIAGPTASGKSALALALAGRLGGVVINADSMQVYRDLRVITARPSPEEEQRAPHRLYGHVDAAENYSTGRWCRDVADVLDEAARNGRVPIFVGGTGLYFKALTSGLAAVPPIPAEIRESVRGRLATEGVAPLYNELLDRDPKTAHRLMPNDRARISRALEVVLATGRSLSDWHAHGLPPLIDGARAAKVFITCDRTELVRRIEARFGAMLAAGALEEVQALKARALDPALPAMKAHGVPWLIRHFNGEIPLDEAAAGAIMDTRRYAKRQVTWFRNQMTGWSSVPAEAGQAELESQLTALAAGQTLAVNPAQKGRNDP